jgi:hypothetical protein
MYAVVEIDRETIKAAMSDEGSFVRATKEVVKKGVESYMRNLSRALFNDGSGKLGTASAGVVVDSAAADSGVKLTISDFKEANFEERDLVDIGSDKAVEISEVLPETSQIILGCTNTESTPNSGVFDTPGIAVTGSIYMQGSQNKDPEGLKGVLDATTDKKYNIDIARRWKAHQKDAGGAAVSSDLLNEMMLKVEKASGKSPNLIVCSYKQYEKILNLLEDQKRYEVKTRSGLKSKNGADISFSGVEFMSSSGPVGIFPERFVEDDRIYFLNDNHIHIYHRPDFGWFDDDGTVFLRKSGTDAYEARYGGYLECYINPCFHGVLDGLST